MINEKPVIYIQPAFKIWHSFQYLKNNDELSSKFNVNQHVPFKTLLPNLKEEDYIVAMHIYKVIEAFPEILLEIISEFLLIKIKDTPNTEAISKYLNAIINDDINADHLLPDAFSQAKDLQAATLAAFFFIKKLANIDHLDDQYISDISKICKPNNILGANFHPKLLDRCLNLDVGNYTL